MIAVVNGASGFIGTHLVNELIENGHDVYAICRKKTDRFDNLSSHRFHLVIAEQHEIADKLKDILVDVWYQLAWEGASGPMRGNEGVQIANVTLSTDAIHIANQLKCKKIVFAGTIYEEFADEIVRNKNFVGSSYYILAKKFAAQMTMQVAKRMNMDYVWCRFCHPIGRYIKDNQMMAYVVNSFVHNTPTEFGECDGWYDIISVEDLAYAFRLAGEKKLTKMVYYIGSKDVRILKDYIMEAANICKYSEDIGFGKRPADGLVFDKEWFNSKEFIEETGWSERIGYKKSVEKLQKIYCVKTLNKEQI